VMCVVSAIWGSFIWFCFPFLDIMLDLLRYLTTCFVHSVILLVVVIYVYLFVLVFIL